MSGWLFLYLLIGVFFGIDCIFRIYAKTEGDHFQKIISALGMFMVVGWMSIVFWPIYYFIYIADNK